MKSKMLRHNNYIVVFRGHCIIYLMYTLIRTKEFVSVLKVLSNALRFQPVVGSGFYQGLLTLLKGWLYTNIEP